MARASSAWPSGPCVIVIYRLRLIWHSQFLNENNLLVRASAHKKSIRSTLRGFQICRSVIIPSGVLFFDVIEGTREGWGKREDSKEKSPIKVAAGVLTRRVTNISRARIQHALIEMQASVLVLIFLELDSVRDPRLLVAECAQSYVPCAPLQQHL